MWFRAAQVFLSEQKLPYEPDAIAEQLSGFAYQACLPSMPSSAGWVAPIDQSVDGELVHAGDGYILICLQCEEKLLPAPVIRQAVDERVKAIEKAEERKVRTREKQSLKEAVALNLLPRAFSKFSPVYGLVDTKSQRIIVNTTNIKKLDEFQKRFERTLEIKLKKPALKKIPGVLTRWVQHDEAPKAFGIEQAGVLQDPNQQSRVIRAQSQSLFAEGMQKLINDGCQIIQLALNWQDRVNLVINQDAQCRSINYHDEVLELAKDNYTDTPEQRFDTDFIIMAQTLSQLFDDLLPCVSDVTHSPDVTATVDAPRPASVCARD